MRRQEILDRPALVSREIVGDDVDLFATGLVDDDVGEESDELGGGVSRGGLAEHFTGLRIERGDSDSVPWRKYSKPCRSARPGDNGSTGSLPSRAWIAVFSSTQNTAACAGGFRYSPMMSAALRSKSGSFEAM